MHRPVTHEQLDVVEFAAVDERGVRVGLERRRRELRCPLFEFLVERADRAVQRAAMGDEFTCEPHLQLLVLAGKPTTNALEMGRASEHPERHLEGRIELVQMATQLLMHTAALVDDRVAMIDQQLQLPKRLLISARRATAAPASASTADTPRLPTAAPPLTAL